MTPKIDHFAWRVEQLVQEGGFALITGESGTGKSVALRIVASAASGAAGCHGRRHRAAPIEEAPTSIVSWATSSGSSSTPSNRWGGFKALRERWKAHVASSRIRPVLLIDEAQEMTRTVLGRAADPLQCRLRCHVAVDGGPLGRRATLGTAAAGITCTTGDQNPHAAGDRACVA